MAKSAGQSAALLWRNVILEHLEEPLNEIYKELYARLPLQNTP